MNTPSGSGSVSVSGGMQVNRDAPKSVPDPFQASWEALPCISMDLAAAAAADADTAAAAPVRCVHTLKKNEWHYEHDY